jgi:hypothetical protein
MDGRKMKKIVVISLVLVGIFAGCSTKKINGNVDSITSDIGNVIQGKN